MHHVHRTSRYAPVQQRRRQYSRLGNTINLTRLRRRTCMQIAPGAENIRRTPVVSFTKYASSSALYNAFGSDPRLRRPPGGRPSSGENQRLSDFLLNILPSNLWTESLRIGRGGETNFTIAAREFRFYSLFFFFDTDRCRSNVPVRIPRTDPNRQ